MMSWSAEQALRMQAAQATGWPHLASRHLQRMLERHSQEW